MKFLKNSLLLPLLLLSVTMGAFSVSARDFASSSVLSEGRWVKVKVDTTGVQRIGYETLRQWGFSHPERVAVYGYGSVEASMQLATAPDDLPPVSVRHVDGALYFYGEGDLRVNVRTRNSVETFRNYYSYGSHYFLTEYAPAAEMPVLNSEAAPDAERVSTHTALVYHEPELYNPTRGGAFWFSNPVPDGGKYTFSFNMPGYEGNAFFGYKALGKNAGSPFAPQMSGGSNVTISQSGSLKINRSADAKELYACMSGFNVGSFTLNEGTVADLSVGVPPAQRDYVSFFAIDALWVLYSRDNLLPAGDAQLPMHFMKGVTSASLSAADGNLSDVEIWDVTEPRSAARVSAGIADNALNFNVASADGPRKLVAFRHGSSSIATPEYEGVADNSNLHSLTGCDMVIVAPSEFLGAARRLASLHTEMQGLQVEVIDKAAVFNEFSSGSFTATSIRNLTMMLHQRDSRLKYLLLMGGANFDNRSVASSTNAYLPCYQIEGVDNARNVAKALTCDNYFGLIEETLFPDITTRIEPATPRVIDVAVGRLPVLAAGEADKIVDKIDHYFRDSRKKGQLNRMLFMSDYGNKNQHLHGVESFAGIAGNAMPGMTMLKGYLAAFPKIGGINGENLTAHRFTRQAIASGPSFIYYAGHGSQNNLFSDAFFDTSFISKLKYSSNPVLFLASCFPYSFDYSYRGIATDMLFDPEGGCIAVIGAGREVYLTSNQVFSDIMAEKFFTTAPGATLGDIHIAALNEILEGSLLTRTNALNYNLGGDPALPMLRRAYEAVVTEAPADMAFAPGQTTRVAGEIRDADGKLVSDFSGLMEVEIFGAPVSFRSLVNHPDDDDDESRMDLTTDHVLLTSSTCRVEGGRWETTLTVPSSVPDATTSNRLALCATPDAGFDAAAGFAEAKVTAYDPLAATADNESPVIDLEIEGCPDGGEIATRTPSLKVTVADSGSGVFTADNTVGGQLRVTLDGSIVVGNVASMLQSDGTGSYSAICSLGTLSNGHHTVEASVSDNAGNKTSESIDFVIVEPAFECAITPETDIATAPVEFTVSHSLAAQPEVKVIVEDLAGRTVLSQTVSTDTFRWDLTDNEGKPVADGGYRVYAILKAHPRYGSTAPVSVTVIRN